MNIPNSLTILRILLIPCYVGLLIYGKFNLALIVLLVAGLTDALDGAIARMKNQYTRLGAVLDPLADKLLLTSGFITLSMIHLIPSWVTILVVSRDVILMLGTAVAHFTDSRVDITPTFLGKGTTFLQLSYVVMVIFSKFPPHRSHRHAASLVRHGLLHALVRVALSLPRLSAHECDSAAKALYCLSLRASSPAQRLCICLTGLGVASRLAW